MKPIYSNDRKAPRMKKGQFSTQVVTRQLYAEFKKKHPEHKDMTWKEFFLLWQDIAETIRSETIFNPLGVRLGSYTGELKLQYLPHKFKAVDKPTSNEVGEKLDYLNIVTKGNVAKIKWERRWAVKFNKMLQFFQFSPTREINKLAKEQVTAHPEKIRVARNTLGGHSIWRQLK